MTHSYHNNGKRMNPYNVYDLLKVSIIFVGVLFCIAFALIATGASAQSNEKRTHYSDVPVGVWYEGSAEALIELGALDTNETSLRPNDIATRAEVMKILVELYDEPLTSPPQSSFSDVSRSAWYFPYMEAAARAGWLKGDNSCYGNGRSDCTARPTAQVNRAEMATILQRAFRLTYMNLAPPFPDVSVSTWYYISIQTAADHCILQGDDLTGNVRPAANMNRAEMVVMFDRAAQQQRYGQDCTVPVPNVSNVSATSAGRIRVTFNVDMDPNRIGETGRYSLEEIGGSSIAIIDSAVVNARIVDLDIGMSLQAGESYRLSVSSMRTENGRIFDDTQTFAYNVGGLSPRIDTVSVLNTNKIRVQFSEDVAGNTADDAFRYNVARVTGGGTVSVSSVEVINDRTVDLNLSMTLSSQTNYSITAEDMMTEDGEEFTDSHTFMSATTTVEIESVTSLSSVRIRLEFNEDLDEAVAEDEGRYRVSAFGSNLNVSNAISVSNDIVELTLSQALQAQEEYIVTVTNLQTLTGIAFTDNISFVYSPTNVQFSAILNGSSEVPPHTSSGNGTGTFILTSNGLQYDITIQGFSGGVTAAHFHRAASGINGPVAEPITITGNGRITGTWTGLTQEERQDILNGNIYVNIHTAQYPDGEIRGQLLRQ